MLAAAPQREAGRHADPLDAGQRRHTAHHLSEKAGRLRRLRVLRVGHPQSDGQHVLRVEAEVYLHQPLEADEQQAGADEQDERQGDLCDHQPGA